MRLVVIESPYGRNPDGSIASARTIERNVTYLRACMADCLRRGEAPIASHALYVQPGVLDEGKPEERRKGMMAGWAWHAAADAVIRYIDLGVTPGMLDGIAHAHSVGTFIETRELGGQWAQGNGNNVSLGKLEVGKPCPLCMGLVITLDGHRCPPRQTLSSPEDDNDMDPSDGED